MANPGDEREENNILFFPINSPGHIHGGVAIADHLRDLYNYKSTFVIVGKAYNSGVVEHGHQLIELEDLNQERPKKEEQQQQQQQVNINKENFWSQIALNGGFDTDIIETSRNLSKMIAAHYVPSHIANFKQYELILEKFKPRLVLIDDLVVPPCLLSKEGREKYPWVRITSPNPLFCVRSKLTNQNGDQDNSLRAPTYVGAKLMTKEERQKMRKDEPERWQSMLDDWSKTNKLIKTLFFDPLKPIFDYYKSLDSIDASEITEALRDPYTAAHTDSPYLNLYIYPEALDYDQDDDLFQYPPNYMRCNSLMRKTIIDPKEEQYWLELIEKHGKGKQEKVLLSLGSIAGNDPKIVQRLVDILAHDQRRLYIVAKGMLGDQVKLNETNMIGANWIPQPFLLQQVDLAILHGGNNGLSECMHYGIPCIIMPMFSDQFDNAQRVEDLRLGRRLNLHRCSRDELLQAVNELLGNMELRNQLSSIGKRMQANNDLTRVAEVLHAFVNNPKCLSANREMRNKYSITGN